MELRRRRPGEARRVLERARRGGYAVGAFNAGTFEALRAVVNVAHRLRSPVILETSSGETDYIGLSVMVALVRSLQATVRVPLLLNLDHAKEPNRVREAIRAGFDLVHYDGSLLAPSANAANLRRLVPLAHRAGILVEAEREHIAGNSTLHPGTLQDVTGRTLTKPETAKAFVRSTGVDTLAVAVGEAHGLYQAPKQIDTKLIGLIRRAVPGFLSLHGGSGIPASAIRAAIRAGITKINVNTELRAAYASSLRRELQRTKSIVPYEFLPPVIQAVERVVEQKMRLFGSVGKA